MEKYLNALILEDSPSDAFLLLRELRKGGFEVNYVRVENADDMLLALRDLAWDVILSDYSMPSFDAPAALRIVRELGFDIPFIIISGTVGEDTAVEAMKAGASDFFVKGNLTRLVSSIERELQEASSRRQRREAETRFSVAFQRSPVGTVISRVSDGIVLDVNQCFLEMYGLSREEVIGKTGEEISIWMSSSFVIDIGKRLEESGSVQNIEIQFQHVSGLSGYALFSAEVIELDNEPCILSMIHDITDRKSAEQAVRQFAERLEFLHEIDRAILTAKESKAVAELVISRLQAALGFDGASIVVFEIERHHFTILATIASIASYNPYEDMSNLDLLTSNEYYYVEDLLEVLHPSSNDIALIHAEIRSSVHIPLIAQNKLLGYISLRAKEPKAFSAPDLTMAVEVGAQLAIAIDNNRLLEVEQRRNSELTALHQASLHFTNSLDMSTVLDIVLDYAILLTQANNAHIFLFDGEILSFGASIWDNKKQDKPLAEPRQTGLTYLVARSGEKLVVTDVKSHPLYRDWQWDGAIIGIPLHIDNEVKGVMSVTYLQPHHFDEHEIHVLELLADQVAISIHNAQLYDQIRNHAQDLEKRVVERTTELQASENKYRALIEFAPDPIVIVDSNGKINLINKRTIDFLGYEPHELIGQSVQKLVPKHLRENHETHRKQYMISPNQRVVGNNLDLTVRHKDGTEIPVKIGLSPITTNTDVLVMAYIVDVTTEKLLESGLRQALAKEKELNELKTRFVSMVSHDFRTPLTVIQTSTDLLRTHSSQMDEERKMRHFARIRTQIDRMTNLLEDVMMISRAEYANAVDIDFDMFCRGLIEEFQTMPDMKHDLVYRGAPEPIQLAIDEKLMQQALINLMTNAAKYSPEGSTITFELYEHGENAVLRVIDQGIGIPEADQQNLFDPFYRATNVGEIQGTGLGLAIVKRSIYAHNGSIEVESVVGKGTIFIIKLPIKRKADD